MDGDVRRLHVGGQVREAHATGDDRPGGETDPIEHPRERPRVGHRAHEQESDPRHVDGGSRDRPGDGLDLLFRGEQAEAAHDEIVGRDAEARAQRGGRPRGDGGGGHGHGHPGRDGVRNLAPHRVRHERVVHRGHARGLDGETEERIRVGQQRPHRPELRFEEAGGPVRVAVAQLGSVRLEGGTGRLLPGAVGRVLRGGRVEDHPRPRVMEHEVVEDEQAREPGQQVVEEVVLGPVAHLVDRRVVGALPMAVEQRRRPVEAYRGGQAAGLDFLLRVEDVDLVAGREQREHVGRVVGDARARGGQRGDERDPAQRRASRTYSCGA